MNELNEISNRMHAKANKRDVAKKRKRNESNQIGRQQKQQLIESPVRSSESGEGKCQRILVPFIMPASMHE